MRFLVNFCFDGKNYNGYATQPHRNTIQDEIERVLKVIAKKKIKTFATSRTDSKVHALDMYLVFDIDINITTQALFKAMNSLINDDIYIIGVKEVDSEYFPRFDVQYKTYRYIVTTQKNPFWINYKYYYPHNIDINKVKKASKLLIGKHDFTSFCNPKKNTDDPIREIYDIKVICKSNDIIFYVTGDGFLYNMVRIIIATLIYIGSNDLKAEYILEILEAKDRKKAFFTAPAHGLYLKETKLRGEN